MYAAVHKDAKDDAWQSVLKHRLLPYMEHLPICHAAAAFTRGIKPPISANEQLIPANKPTCQLNGR